MNTIDLGNLDTIKSCMNLYINLTPNGKGIMPYENIVLQYGEEQLTIPVEQLFEKLKELFKEDAK